MKEVYSFRVKGQLDPKGSSWFDGLIVTHTLDDETTLSGPIVDRADLHGVLLKNGI